MLQHAQRLRRSVAPIVPWQVPGCLGFLLSDRGITWGSPGTLVAVGTSPAVSVTGTATGYYDMRVRIVSGGSLGAAAGEWSSDGGVSYTPFTTATSVVLGSTGDALTMSAGTYNVDSSWSWLHKAVTWSDTLTGSNFSVSQSASASRPLVLPTNSMYGGRPSFDLSSSQFFKASIVLNQPMNVFAVCAWPASATATQVAFGSDQGWQVKRNAGDTTLFVCSSDNSVHTITATKTVSSVVVRALFNSAASVLALGATQVSGDAGPTNSTSFEVGSLSSIGSYFFRGSLSAISLFRALKPADASGITKWLSRYFSVPL
jgi:hypothetical protein